MEKVALEAHNPHLKNKVYWIVYPTYAEAKEAIWKDPSMLFRVIPHELVARQNEMELTLYLHSGSIICLKGADDEERLRGAGPYGIIFDEFATMKYEAWGIIEPILRANGGWAWFVGTPRGKNHLFDLYQRGQQGHFEWKSWLLKASQSGIISKDQLEESKKTMSQSLYNQEWECEWLEGEGSVFRGVKEIMTATPQKPITGHLYVMGVDLAKVTDYTVLAVYDRHTNEQVYQDRFNKLEWPFQKKKIIEIARHYNNALIEIDATGIGDPIADDLMRANLSVEPIKFTESMKKDLVEKLSIWIEQQKIKMLPLEETGFEFDNFSYEIGPTGKIRYGARVGFNDDIVMAHSLAVWSLQPIYIQPKEKVPTLMQKAYRQALLKREDQNEGSEWSEWSEL